MTDRDSGLPNQTQSILHRPISRRGVIFGAPKAAVAIGSLVALGGLSTIFEGCADGEDVNLEKVSRTKEINLTGVGKVPLDYIPRGTYTLLDREIFERLTVDVPYDAYTPDNDRSRSNYSAQFNLDSADFGYSFFVRSPYGRYGPRFDIDIIVTAKASKNRYQLSYGSDDDTKVIDGETATKAEGEAIRDGLGENLVKQFNSMIDQGEVVRISESYNRAVLETPAPVADTPRASQ